MAAALELRDDSELSNIAEVGMPRSKEIVIPRCDLLSSKRNASCGSLNGEKKLAQG